LDWLNKQRAKRKLVKLGLDKATAKSVSDDLVEGNKHLNKTYQEIKNQEDSTLYTQNYTLPTTDLLDMNAVSSFKKSETLTLKSVIESEDYMSDRSPLTIPLGKSENGKIETINIHDVGCILAAGQTGSGKSTFTETTLILSLLLKNSPDDLRLLLIDPKMVQFSQYKGIPHLLTPTVTTPEVAREAFGALVKEIDRRKELFATEGVKDFDEYSSKIQKLPFIMVVIDEVIDLFMVDGEYYEKAFISIAKNAKTTGVHLYMGTSRPTRDAYNANLLSHFPTRIAFTVASEYDSDTLLGEAGAEQLSGNGDLLYRSGKDAPLIRIQSPFATDEDVMKVANFWRDSK
jgi:S-DNA-T family DNA segregation ATPase FtsK/SpoIIIE